MNKARQLVDQAIEGFRQATELGVAWEPIPTDDFDGCLTIDTGSKVIRLATEVRQRLMAHHIAESNRSGKNGQNTILLAEHIPDALKQMLRQTHRNYLDGAGNCYVQAAGMLLIVQGRKLVQPTAVTKGPLGKSGLRVLFTLLIHPDLINLSVRELAEQTGVSVGTAQQTIGSLKKRGHVVAIDRKRRKLINLDKLREEWVSRYVTTLKPGLFVGRFRLPKNLSPADWRQLTLQTGTYWSGEAAADTLTGNLRPATLTLYTDQDRAGLLKAYRLIPDPDGAVEVYERFWKETDSQSDIPTAPPLLIYADLLAIDDPRTTDTARRIYQEYIAHA